MQKHRSPARGRPQTPTQFHLSLRGGELPLSHLLLQYLQNRGNLHGN